MFLFSIRIPNLSLNGLKQIAKMRRIKNYRNMSKERLLSAIDRSELAGSGNDFHIARIKKITKDFHKLKDIFLKPKIKEIRNNLMTQKTQKIFLNQK